MCGLTRWLRRFAQAGVFAGCTLTAASAAPTPTAGGITLSNTVTGSYADRAGHVYSSQSNTIVEIIADVAALTVSPSEGAANAATDVVAQGQPATRTFTIVNGGNIRDSYALAALDAGPAKITSIVWSGPAGAAAGNVSPLVPPGASISLAITVATAGVPIGSTFAITLTIHSTASAVNGPQIQSAKQWVIVQSGPRLAGPGGPASEIAQTVKYSGGSTASPGASATFTFTFKNYGASPAVGTVVNDTLPAGLLIDTSSATINGRLAGTNSVTNGQLLTLSIGSVGANVSVNISFTVAIGASVSLGSSFVNEAQISAVGITAISTPPISLFIGVSNTIFDGDAGTPVAGVVATLLDARTNLPVVPAAASHAGAAARAMFSGAGPNPFTSTSAGFYGFPLAPSQLGTAASPSRFVLTVAAHGYLNRRLDIALSTAAIAGFVDVTLAALDGQPVAAVGGFTSVVGPVMLYDIADRLPNIPIFKASPATIANVVDRSVAASGDRLTYTLSVSAGQGETLRSAEVVATLPPAVAFAPGTTRLDGERIEPRRIGRALHWAFSDLNGQHVIRYAAVVLTGVPEQTLLIDVATMTSHSIGGRIAQTSASAVTQVVGGVLSDRAVVTGRVFADVRGTGRFESGDSGVSGVRIFVENGQSVTTDRDGRFSFPALRPGQHVLRLDTLTIPPGLRAAPDRRYDSARSTVRLVHGVMDAGLIQDIEFALEPAS